MATEIPEWERRQRYFAYGFSDPRYGPSLRERARKRQPITREWVADMLERAMASGVGVTPPAATRSRAEDNHEARVRALELAGWDHAGAELWLRSHPGPEFCPIHAGQNLHGGYRRGRIEER
jgi:hypothetical protein